MARGNRSVLRASSLAPHFAWPQVLFRSAGLSQALRGSCGEKFNTVDVAVAAQFAGGRFHVGFPDSCLQQFVL